MSANSPASCNELLDFFKSNNAQDLQSIDSLDFMKEIESLLNAGKQTDKTEMKRVENLLNWTKLNKNYLKAVSINVPSSILGNNSVLHDLKVFSRGPDDKVYDQNSDIRAKIARGNCILERDVNGTKNFDLVVYALRKFTGGLGDEDDTDRQAQDWRKYFVKKVGESKYVASLQKANGEAAHLACRWIGGEFCVFAGSKNVHLAFKKRSDLEFYKEERYSYAVKIAAAIANHLDKMESRKKHLFLSFLSLTKLTCIFEILIPTSQHVEDLTYLKEPLLKFIVFTQNKVLENPTNLCCHPKLSIEIATLFDFSCVKCTEFLIKDVEAHLVEIRKGFNYEGDVLYFIDSAHNVIGLLKKKTVWYIIVRALREKIRAYFSKNSDQNLENTKEKIGKRLSAIQKWICFSQYELLAWKNLSFEFADWFDAEFRKTSIDRETYSSNFPTYWSRFLKETGKTDKIDMVFTKEFAWSIDEEETQPENDARSDSNEQEDSQDEANVDEIQIGIKKLTT